MIGCRAFTDAEIDTMLSRITNPRDRLLLIFGVRTGFRISELLSLRVSDVYRDGAVFDSVYVQRRNMKGKQSGRTVPLHNEVRELLSIYCKNMRSDFYLFKSRELFNAPLSRVQAYRIISAAARRVGLQGRIATHSMRKTFAERINRTLNNDIYKLQKAMGHRSIDSTARYITVNQEEVDRAILK